MALSDTTGSYLMDPTKTPITSSTRILFAYSGLFSFLVLFLAVSSNYSTVPISYKAFTKFFSRDALIQVISFFFLIFIVARSAYFAYYREDTWRPYKLFWSKALLPVVLVTVITINLLFFDDLLAQLAFFKGNLPRAIEDAGVPGFLQRLRSAFEMFLLDETTTHSRTPSGFALRQWVFFLVALFALVRGRFSRTFTLTATSWFVLTFVYVAFARISRGFHLPIDVATSISLGTLLFMMTMSSWAIFADGEEAQDLLDCLLVYGLVTMGVYLLISNNPIFWLILIPITGLLLGVLELIINTRQRRRSSRDAWRV